MILPTPVYRFFSKKEHLNDLVINGRMRFTPTSAFGELKDMNYRDEGENYYHFKIREDKSHTIIVDGKERLIEGGTVHSTYRKSMMLGLSAVPHQLCQQLANHIQLIS